MASVRKRKRKDGSMFYEIQVSRGRGLSPYTMRWDRPEGLAERTIQSQLRTVAVNFENDCKAGKVRTRREEKEAAELERKEREKAEQDKVTFRRFCNESFLPAIRARASQTSAYNYELQLKKHIFPVLGGLEMTEIRAGDINQLLRQILAEGKSDAVAVKTYTIIRSVMKMAYADELIERNPMERVDRPHKRKQNGEAGDVKSCTAEELRRLCEALREEPYLWQVLVRLLIDSGMRIGECVGLLWENLNFEKNMICVNGALKYTPDKGIVLLKSYNDYYFGYDDENGKHQKGYEERIAELIQKYPLGQQIVGEKAEKDFIISFGNILRLRNILSTFDNFAGNEILVPVDFQDYTGIYNDLYAQDKKQEETNMTIDSAKDLQMKGS